jgi:hypothetical protein
VSKEFFCCIKYTFLAFSFLLFFRGHLFELLQQQLSSTLAPVVDDELICAVLFLLSLQETLLFIQFHLLSRWMREREKRLTPPFAIRSASPDIIHRDNMRPEIKKRGPGNLIIKRTMMISLYRKYLFLYTESVDMNWREKSWTHY